MRIFYLIDISLIFSSCVDPRVARNENYKKLCEERGLVSGSAEFWNCVDMQELKRSNRIQLYGTHQIINKK